MHRDRKDIFEELEKKIETDFEPVRPVWGTVKRVLLFLPLWFGLLGAVFLIFGFRSYYGELGRIGAWLMALFQTAFAITALWVALRFVIPGELLSNRLIALGAGFGVGAHFLVALLFDTMSPASVPAEAVVRLNLICLSMVVVLSLTPFLVGAYLARRGLLIYPAVTGALLGLGSALGAEAAWRMHCSISSWDHVLFSHTLGIVVAVLIGLGGGYLWKRQHL